MYKEVIKVLDEFISLDKGIVIPITEYYFFGIKAIIRNREGVISEAKLFAQKALAASNKANSGLSRHPTVGLVNKSKDLFYDELVSIVD